MRKTVFWIAQVIFLGVFLLLLVIASAGPMQRGIQSLDMIIVGLLLAVGSAEIWMAFIASKKSNRVRIALRATTIGLVTYIGWFSSGPWFRVVEDAGLKNEALVNQLNRGHLIEGLIVFCFLILITTLAVAMVPRPRDSQAVSPLIQNIGNALLFATGSLTVALTSSALFFSGLFVLFLSLTLTAARILRNQTFAFWTFIAEIVLFNVLLAIGNRWPFSL